MAGILGAILALLVIFGGIGGCMSYYPEYAVYQQSMEGKAAYAKAEADRQIRVLEAKAALESAEMTSQAEIQRARGVAEANRIIADGLGGPEGYLRWRYIEMLENTGSKGGRDVIYIPTEANLPILEAGQRK